MCYDGAQRLALQVGQPRRLGVALRRPDVRRDAADEQPAVPLGEHRDHVVRLATLGLLAAEVVRELVVERGGEVGPLGDELVVDAHRVGDRGEAAADARSRGTSDRRGRSRRSGTAAPTPPSSLPRAGGVVGCLVLVGDVAEHVAVLVLRPRQTEVGADAPVEDLHLRLRVGAAVDAAQAHEAAAVDELVLDARRADAGAWAAGSRRGRARARRRILASAWRSAASSSASSASSKCSVHKSSSATSAAVHSHCGSRMRGVMVPRRPFPGRAAGRARGARAARRSARRRRRSRRPTRSCAGSRSLSAGGACRRRAGRAPSRAAAA